MKVAKSREAKLVAARAATGLALSPAFATSAGKKRPAPVSLSFDSLSSFTPANADPKLAAALAGKSLSLTDFKFTPAPTKGRPSQVRVAIRARVDAPAEARLAQFLVVSAALPDSEIDLSTIIRHCDPLLDSADPPVIESAELGA